MKNKPVFVFFISTLAIFCSFAQDNKEKKLDTLPEKTKIKEKVSSLTDNKIDNPEKVYYQHYGLRIGADISKPIHSILDKKYQGLELVADYRWNYRYYLAGEIGKERKENQTNYFDYTTNGQYIKLGIDYNSYDNWYGMENMIYFGGRYGFSIFNQEVSHYTLHTLHNYWEESLIGTKSDILTTYKGRTAHWLEAFLGIKVELFKHFYAGASIRFSFLLFQKKNDFPNFWIPGIQRVWEGSNFGINYNYTLSYLIPLYKKVKEKTYKSPEKEKDKIKKVP